MGLYRRKAAPAIEAVRFMPNDDLKQFVTFVSRHCSRISLTVQEGLIVAYVTFVDGAQTTMTAGSWLVRLENGHVTASSDAYFQAGFEEV